MRYLGVEQAGYDSLDQLFMPLIEFGFARHELADQMPVQSQERYAELCLSIEELGFDQSKRIKCLPPVENYERGVVVDGRHRLLALLEMFLDGCAGDATIDEWLKGKIEYIAESDVVAAVEPNLLIGQRQISYVVSVWMAAKLSILGDGKPSRESVSEIAVRVGVAKRSVFKAKFIQSAGCEQLHDAVLCGDISISVAEEFCRYVEIDQQPRFITSDTVDSVIARRKKLIDSLGGSLGEVRQQSKLVQEVAKAIASNGIDASDYVFVAIHCFDEDEEFFETVSKNHDISKVHESLQKYAPQGKPAEAIDPPKRRMEKWVADFIDADLCRMSKKDLVDIYHEHDSTLDFLSYLIFDIGIERASIRKYCTLKKYQHLLANCIEPAPEVREEESVEEPEAVVDEEESEPEPIVPETPKLTPYEIAMQAFESMDQESKAKFAVEVAKKSLAAATEVVSAIYDSLPKRALPAKRNEVPVVSKSQLLKSLGFQKKKVGGAFAAAVDHPLPDSINTPEMKEAWVEWVTYASKVTGVPVHETIVSKFAEFETWGAEQSIEAIKLSIKQGYRSIIKKDNLRASKSELVKKKSDAACATPSGDLEKEFNALYGINDEIVMGESAHKRNLPRREVQIKAYLDWCNVHEMTLEEAWQKFKKSKGSK